MNNQNIKPFIHGNTHLSIDISQSEEKYGQSSRTDSTGHIRNLSIADKAHQRLCKY